MNKIKPEAVYFMPIEGHRAGAFIVNIDSNAQLPAIVEPLLQWWGANVDTIPVMSFDDLEKGFTKQIYSKIILFYPKHQQYFIKFLSKLAVQKFQRGKGADSVRDFEESEGDNASGNCEIVL